MVKVSPSMLAADFSNLREEMKSVQTANFLHLDVMDGHFVPNLTIGPCVIASIRPHSDLPFDTHLMIDNPLKYIEPFAKAGSDYITVHVEQPDDIKQCIRLIKSFGKKAGLALSPDTPVSALAPYLDEISMITVMSVYPGFGGQKFIESSYEKIKEISNMIQDKNILLSVDGGVDYENVRKLEKAGVTMVVAGSTVFGDENREEAIRILRGE
ncbi:MAG: ribulose-phosphate 3-epimerase [Ruminococcaceae bacterium]|nr:ribulose-phosphate 3-epimerase [Oscillospiraceae bacterium]